MLVKLGQEIRIPNRSIWSRTRYHCAIAHGGMASDSRVVNPYVFVFGHSAPRARSAGVIFGALHGGLRVQCDRGMSDSSTTRWADRRTFQISEKEVLEPPWSDLLEKDHGLSPPEKKPAVE